MKILKANFISISIATLVLCIGLYQFSFWECFAFNPMATLSFQELVTSGINIFVYSILCSILLIIFLRVSIPKSPYVVVLNKGIRKPKGFFVYTHLAPPKKINSAIPTKRRKIITRSGISLCICFLVCISALRISVEDWIFPIWIFTFLLICLTITFLTKNLLFSNLFKSGYAYVFTLLFLVSLPFVSIAAGLHKAVKIKNNTSYDYILLKAGKEMVTRYKLLSINSESLILCTMDNNQIVIFLRDNIRELKIMHHREYRETDFLYPFYKQKPK